MFDIGFAEVLIVGILGLIILGPERLPGAIRTAALWIGRCKRRYRNIRHDIEQEVGADDIRRQLYNEEIIENLKASGEEFRSLKESTEMELNAIQGSKPNSKQQQDAVQPPEQA